MTALMFRISKLFFFLVVSTNSNSGDLLEKDSEGGGLIPKIESLTFRSIELFFVLFRGVRILKIYQKMIREVVFV